MDEYSLHNLQRKIDSFKQQHTPTELGHINRTDPLSLNNIHKGKRCFILGTASTIDDIDLGKLKDEITFGLNSIVNAYIPNYWVGLSNGAFIPSSNVKLIYQSKLIFLSDVLYNIFERCMSENKVEMNAQKNIIYFPDSINENIDYGVLTSFKGDIITIHNGSSVLFPAIQIAYAMGCDPIYLLGISMKKNSSKPRYFSSSLKKKPLTTFANELATVAMSKINIIAMRDKRRILSATPDNLLVDRGIIKEVQYNSLF